MATVIEGVHFTPAGEDRMQRLIEDAPELAGFVANERFDAMTEAEGPFMVTTVAVGVAR